MMFQNLSLREKKWLLLFLSLLLCWWLFLASGTASASEIPEEQTRVITVAELDRLDSIFSQLSQDNGKLLNELTDSRTALLKSQADLKAAQQELKRLQLHLAELKALSVNQESSLQKANELLAQHAAEEKKTRLRVKSQRNMWATACVLACIGLAIK